MTNRQFVSAIAAIIICFVLGVLIAHKLTAVKNANVWITSHPFPASGNPGDNTMVCLEFDGSHWIRIIPQNGICTVQPFKK